MSCQFASTSRTISPKASITNTKNGPRRRIVIIPTSAAQITTAASATGAAAQKLQPSFSRNRVDTYALIATKAAWPKLISPI